MWSYNPKSSHDPHWIKLSIVDSSPYLTKILREGSDALFSYLLKPQFIAQYKQIVELGGCRDIRVLSRNWYPTFLAIAAPSGAQSSHVWQEAVSQVVSQKDNGRKSARSK